MSSRLKSAIWVSAFLRQSEVNGMFGAIIHKGADDAGAVYVVVNHLDGTSDFLGPPPGEAYDADGVRRFRREISEPQSWEAIAGRISRLRRLDADIWVVEVEDRNGLAGIQPETD